MLTEGINFPDVGDQSGCDAHFCLKEGFTLGISVGRVHAIVHLRTRLEPGTIVPIGWVAAGDPAHILPPDKHEEIWAIIKPLNFPQWVYRFERGPPDLMVHITHRLPDLLWADSTDGDLGS